MRKNRKIYLIRHCEPELPEKNSICLGRKDVPLSSKGLEQANNLRKTLSKINIEAVYSSPLIRALKTAEIIFDEAVNIEIIEEFNELDVGKWDGMSFDEIKENYPQEYEDRGKNFETYVIDDGESMLACKNRSLKGLNKILNNSKGDIAVVSHAGVIRLILSDILNISIKKSFSCKLEYGSITILNYGKNKFEVKKLGLGADNFINEVEGNNE